MDMVLLIIILLLLFGGGGGLYWGMGAGWGIGAPIAMLYAFRYRKIAGRHVNQEFRYLKRVSYNYA